MLASHLWNNFLFLTHSSWAFSWVSCMGFYHFNIILIHFYWLLLPDSVVGFPALVFCILWKPVIWLLLRFNWLVVTRCTTGYGESWNRLQTATGLEPRTTLVINKYSTVWPNWPKATTECGFTLKRVHDMIRTYSQMQHSSIIWPVSLNCSVFIYELSDCGFESPYSHLNFKFCACFEQGVPWHSGKYIVWIHSETRTWYDKIIQSNPP